jgi:hypothetical protein
MKNRTLFLNLFVFTLVLLVFACKNDSKEQNTNSTESNQNQKITKTTFTNPRENLNLANQDTIKVSKSYPFSNHQTQDVFLLTVPPGLVKNSKSVLEIKTAKNKVIYTDTFDTYHFIAGIFRPDTIPTDGIDEYEKYIAQYHKSLTTDKIQDYFQKNLQDFDSRIKFVERSNLKEMLQWGEVEDKEALNEVMSDPTIILADITCFDCDEGGIVIFYSKKRNKVITLLAHD